MRRSGRDASPSAVPRHVQWSWRPRSSHEHYPWRDRLDVDGADASRTNRRELLTDDGRIGDEACHVDGVARRRERAEAFDPLVDEHGCAVEVALLPVMETHADLQDPVVEPAVRSAGVAPEQLERLVLLEELPVIELFYALEELT